MSSTRQLGHVFLAVLALLVGVNCQRPDYDRLTRLAALKGDWVRILNLAQAWKRADPNSLMAELLYVQAVEEVNPCQGKYKEALKATRVTPDMRARADEIGTWARGLVQMDSTSPWAYFYCAVLTAGIAAKPYFLKALQLDATFYRSCEELGGIYADMGNSDSALKYLEAALMINPGAHRALHYAGRVYLARGDSVRAESCMVRAIRTNPKCGDSHASLGMLFLARQEFTAARAEAHAAIKLNPDWVVGYRVLFSSYAEEGMDDSLKIECRRVTEGKSALGPGLLYDVKEKRRCDEWEAAIAAEGFLRLGMKFASEQKDDSARAMLIQARLSDTSSERCKIAYYLYSLAGLFDTTGGKQTKP